MQLGGAATTHRAAGPPRVFDGVICIGGEDWWYHNRGHFDFQIMRRLARQWPVLFVNSLGLRIPSLRHDPMFAARIGRKLQSLAHGLARIENGFWVFSPLAIPGPAGQRLSSWTLGPQIRIAAARIGIRRPLLWVHCPAGASLVHELRPVAAVLQRTDRFEALPDAESAEVCARIAALKRAADLVIYAAPGLAAEEAGMVRRQLVVTHGVDLEAFATAGAGNGPIPPDIAPLPRPRIGFIGGIDAHTFDPELFLGLARLCPDYQFVLVGACSLPPGWCALPNVSLTGRKPYAQVPSYMAAMDALIMPWNRSAWIAACNPVKLKEYLAVGRPVITTDFPALAPWRDLVRVASDPDGFANALRWSLVAPFPRQVALSRLAGETWDAKAAEVRSALLGLGLAFHGVGARAAA